MAKFKIYDFLESNDFDKESSTFLSSTISHVIKPNNLEGFIFSFFKDYDNPNATKNIFPFGVKDDGIYSLTFNRHPDLFDFEKQTVTLTEKEIEYIQNEYFGKQLEAVYKRLFSDLDAFHRHFEERNKFSLDECYDIILNFLSDSRGLYQGNISNINRLELTKFKDLTQSKLLSYKGAVDGKKSSLEYSKNKADEITYPKDIFKSAKSFLHFKEYVNSYNMEPYKDYSYLFQRMLAEDYIYRLLHRDFTNWLVDNNYITKEEYELIMEKGNFMSLRKSESKARKTNFDNIFF
jgi:hypothetical protein